MSEELTINQGKQVQSILKKYKDVFTDVPGPFKEYDIPLNSEEPIRHNPYAMPYALQKKVTQKFLKMLDFGILKGLNSSMLILSSRICVGFRLLNRITIFDAEPMPNPKDIMVKITHAN